MIASTNAREETTSRVASRGVAATIAIAAIAVALPACSALVGLSEYSAAAEGGVDATGADGAALDSAPVPDAAREVESGPPPKPDDAPEARACASTDECPLDTVCCNDPHACTANTCVPDCRARGVICSAGEVCVPPGGHGENTCRRRCDNPAAPPCPAGGTCDPDSGLCP